MQIEERSLGSTGLNRYYRSARALIFFGLQCICQLFYGRAGKESRGRNPLATHLLNWISKASSQQRISSQIEKVIPDPDWSHTQQVFPDLYKLMMQRRRWSDKGFSQRMSDRIRCWYGMTVNLIVRR